MAKIIETIKIKLKKYISLNKCFYQNLKIQKSSLDQKLLVNFSQSKDHKQFRRQETPNSHESQSFFINMFDSQSLKFQENLIDRNNQKLINSIQSNDLSNRIGKFYNNQEKNDETRQSLNQNNYQFQDADFTNIEDNQEKKNKNEQNNDNKNHEQHSIDHIE
ncbi:hypothetical protein ABPG72_000869 [Tetrahymena utriculariae]